MTGTRADSFLVFVKSECETCRLVRPVLKYFTGSAGKTVTIHSQDSTEGFPELDIHLDGDLENSFRHDIEAVPTLIALKDGKEVGRTFGWNREDWEKLTGDNQFPALDTDAQPGCGSRTREPGIYEHLVARFGDPGLAARRIELRDFDDPIEAAYERGWSDGLPVVPPTDARVLRMLDGTKRAPGEIVGDIPPNLAPCTVEKVAINAVLAGCKPEYMPVVLAAVAAALDPLATMHGVLCTTCFSGPILIVNGPIARAIGMNSGINALGPGNRANATIGRALQLVVRNVGGGKPGELDRAVLGGPGKYTFCFAEDESDPEWEPLSVSRGFARGANTVTLFQGDGIQGFIDQRSRTPDQLARSLAMALTAVGHPKLCEFTNAMLVLVPEHYAIFRDAGWDRARIEAGLRAALRRPGKELIQGAQGVGEGIAPARAGEMIDKFWPDGLLIVRAGGKAGLFSAICAGWTGGRFRDESKTVTKEIAP